MTPDEETSIVRIFPKTVVHPIIWGNIKWACAQADEVDPNDYSAYFNELLQALLSEKAQCWLRFRRDDRRLLAMLITRVTYDKLTGKKELYLQCLYSLEPVAEQVWGRDWEYISEFVRQQECETVYFNSRHKRLWDLAEKVGFREKYRTYEFKVRGA